MPSDTISVCDLKLNDAIKWECTVGYNQGYELTDENGISIQQKIDITEIIKKIQAVQEELFKNTDVFISCVIKESRTLYAQEWGCPPSTGEYTFTLSGCSNPYFVNNSKYQDVLGEFIMKIKDSFNQSAVQLEIWPIKHIYLV